jgi:hypothetical protein
MSAAVKPGYLAEKLELKKKIIKYQQERNEFYFFIIYNIQTIVYCECCH